ncbi:LuxR C-terminal-related transcriptional regulator [Rhizobium sp. L1K21]|uniref:LuxR C-terminal-related transcriptional regulator n=1 Tax=Rhizobium sp. L1K21 TaxID=2954933 RepID=UPI002093CCD1|nr:LuxR C-terminal-related transcriptional regulator [Rhizobium sp. L1K21]MCO6186782.1 LuxR C-terminal-related transcriptional regulator [Rhizobium sp. L1K21]
MLAELAFEHAPVGLVLTEDRIIKRCNRLFATMFGYQQNELEGQSFRMLYASNTDFETIREIGFAALKTKRLYSDERLMPRRDGTLFWCRFRAYAFDPENPLKRTILSYADLSETRPVISLTRRERDIIKCLARGLTAKETARDLSISPRTVEDYRARLLRKFEVKNVSGLLARISGFEA